MTQLSVVHADREVRSHIAIAGLQVNNFEVMLV